MRLVYGRAGSGKSYYCMNQIKENIENEVSKTLIYIVPEQYSLSAEFELSNMLKRNGTINIQVLSFKRLAYRLFNELGFTKTAFSKASKSMLIYHIMMEQEKNLLLLKGVNKNRGLVDTVDDMISEFKRYNISWETLMNIKIENEYLRMKLHDLALIYQIFEERIGKEYIDIDSRLTILSKFISKSNMLKGSKIWIDEFDNFTPQEFEIIQELEKVADVTITLTLDRNEKHTAANEAIHSELFVMSQKVYDKLKKISNIEEIYLENPKRYTNHELCHLEQNIFQFPYIKYDKPTKNLHIHIEANPYSEIENVAKIISKKVREENLRYENIAILTRDIDSHKTIFKRVFKKYDIPYFFDDKKELAMQPLFNLITSLFDIVTKNFKYENVFNYLKTGFTNIQEQDDIDLIENYVLQYGIRGISKWQKTWEYPHDNLEKINYIRQNIVEPIIHFKETISGKKSAKEIAERLYQFLIETNVYDHIKSKVDTLLNLKEYSDRINRNEMFKSSELEIANTYIQVWNILMNLLDELVACLGNEQMSFDMFKNVLLQGISKHQIGILPTSNDQIMIGDISRTRNSNVQVLFIIGVNDGVFPKPFSSEGFINDSERDYLLEKGIEIAKNTKLLLLEENFNIYKALTTPSNEIYLSYPIANSEGGALRPSTIINQLKNIFPNIDLQSNILKENDDIITADEAFNPLLKNIRNYFDGKEIDSKWKNAYLWYFKNSSEKLLKVQSGLDYKNTIEYLDKNHSQKLYGKELYGSVSRLETYSNCPFSFYLRYGLKIKDRKIFKLDTPDVGLFLHDIIDKFSKYFMERNVSLRDVSKEEADKVVSQLVDESLKDFKNNIFNSSNQMKVLSSKLKRVVKRMVWIIIHHIRSGEFEIEETEVGFGKDKQFSAVEIELSDGNKLMLTGVIDRIDIAKTEEGKYIRIIDYKSYNKDLKLSDIYYGLQLQLLVYMDAAIRKYSK
ncbi:MAG: exodeoxyribonuclease V subunit gamma [Clostridia bacterium]|nr:exodeoxyribonuclease V subunit gamma [Clostridia bacterium]